MPTLAQRLRMRETRVRLQVLDRAVHAFARVRHAMPDAHPARHHVHVLKDVAYGDDHPALRLDVYVPSRSPKPLPVVMYVHGGGFRVLSKETHFVMAMAFARRGYLVFNVDYRFGFGHPFPAPLEDASRALLWIHRHAAEYGGDRQRIALAGESAGGNLVVALALLSAVRREERFAAQVFDANVSLRATVATYPFCDLTDVTRMQTDHRLSRLVKSMAFDAAAAYLGVDEFPSEQAPELASPLLVLESDTFAPHRPMAPFFLSAGTRDPILKHTKRLKQALDRHGVPAELFIAPGEIHGFDALIWRPQARLKWQHTHRFLAHHMAETSAAPGLVERQRG